MSAEALLAAGYALSLALGAGVLEWLSGHSHRRSERWRTAGFDYDEQHDHWTCPEGQHLWPHEYDTERRLVRYRARAHICNGCPRKADCTDSAHGREVVRALDPWPHSEAGRFHRVVSLMLVTLALLVLVVAATRNREPAELGLLLGGFAMCLLVLRRLARDLRLHPAGFPEPSPSHGLRLRVGGTDRSRYASQNRADGEL